MKCGPSVTQQVHRLLRELVELPGLIRAARTLKYGSTTGSKPVAPLHRLAGLLIDEMVEDDASGVEVPTTAANEHDVSRRRQTAKSDRYWSRYV